MEYDIVRERFQTELGVLCEDQMPSVVMLDVGAMIVTLQREDSVLRVDVPLYSAEVMDSNERLFKLIAQLNGSATAQHHHVFYSLAPSNTLYLSSLLNYRLIDHFDVIVTRLNSIAGNIALLRKLIVDHIDQSKPPSHNNPSELLKKFSFA